MDNAGNYLGKVDTTVMRECSHKWNLANDVDLLKRLETFSQHVLNNTTYALSCMDSLEENLNNTILNVRTITNNFNAIADNQFIENRVQEEEENFSAPPDEPSSMEWASERSDLQLNLHQSLKKCADILEKKFEAIEIPESDSEDDVANGRHIMLVPKNVYKDRPLPHLIGSDDFMKDDTLGLSLLQIEEELESEEEPVNNSGVTSSLNHSEVNHMVSKDAPVTPSRQIREEEIPKLNTHEENKYTNEREIITPVLAKPSQRFEDRSVEDISEIDAAPIKTYGNVSSTIPDPPNESISQNTESRVGGHPDDKFKNDLARVLSMGRASSLKRPKEPEPVHPALEKNSPPPLPKDNEMDVDTESEPDLFFDSPTYHSVHTSVPESNKQLPIDKVTVNSQGTGDLPYVPTKVLHSLAKGRAKVQSKRRLPSRRHRKEGFISSGGSSGNEEDRSSRAAPSSSTILSPSTDEEDLFVLPAFDFPKDISSNNLFFGNTLLSPGVSIDADKLDTDSRSSIFASKNSGENEPLPSTPLEKDPLWLPTSDTLGSSNKFSWNDMESSDMDVLFSGSNSQNEDNISKTNTFSKVSMQNEEVHSPNAKSVEGFFKSSSTSTAHLSENLFSKDCIGDDDDDDSLSEGDLFGGHSNNSLFTKKANTSSFFNIKVSDDEDDDKLFSSGLSNKGNDDSDLFSSSSSSIMKQEKPNERGESDLFGGTLGHVKDPLLFSDDFT